jgi:hypothetical protein
MESVPSMEYVPSIIPVAWNDPAVSVPPNDHPLLCGLDLIKFISIDGKHNDLQFHAPGVNKDIKTWRDSECSEGGIYFIKNTLKICKRWITNRNNFAYVVRVYVPPDALVLVESQDKYKANIVMFGAPISLKDWLMTFSISDRKQLISLIDCNKTSDYKLLNYILSCTEQLECLRRTADLCILLENRRQKYGIKNYMYDNPDHTAIQTITEIVSSFETEIMSDYPDPTNIEPIDIQTMERFIYYMSDLINIQPTLWNYLPPDVKQNPQFTLLDLDAILVPATTLNEEIHVPVNNHVMLRGRKFIKFIGTNKNKQETIFTPGWNHCNDLWSDTDHNKGGIYFSEENIDAAIDLLQVPNDFVFVCNVFVPDDAYVIAESSMKYRASDVILGAPITIKEWISQFDIDDQRTFINSIIPSIHSLIKFRSSYSSILSGPVQSFITSETSEISKYYIVHYFAFDIINNGYESTITKNKVSESIVKNFDNDSISFIDTIIELMNIRPWIWSNFPDFLQRNKDIAYHLLKKDRTYSLVLERFIDITDLRAIRLSIGIPEYSGYLWGMSV